MEATSDEDEFLSPADIPGVCLLPDLQTKRLLLRPYNEEDWENFLQVHQNPTMFQWERSEYIASETYYEALFAKCLLRRWLVEEEVAHFIYAVVRREDNCLIGMVSSTQVTSPEPMSHLGIAIGEGHWRQGYATEASQALLEFAFSRGLKKMFAECYEGNTATVRVLQKLGMHQKPLSFTEKYVERRLCNPGYYMLHFSLTAEQWRQRR